MCFNEIHVAFDENGEAYLAEEADGVTHPGQHAGDGATGCGCDQPVDLTTDPEGAYRAILEELPETAREHLDEASRAGETERRAVDDRDSAEGD